MLFALNQNASIPEAFSFLDFSTLLCINQFVVRYFFLLASPSSGLFIPIPANHGALSDIACKAGKSIRYAAE